MNRGARTRYVPVDLTVEVISDSSDSGRPREGRRSSINRLGERLDINGMTVIIRGTPPDSFSCVPNPTIDMRRDGRTATTASTEELYILYHGLPLQFPLLGIRIQPSLLRCGRDVLRALVGRAGTDDLAWKFSFTV